MFDTLKNAVKEILIVSPFMRKNRLKQLLPVFAQVIQNGVSVSVVTRPPEDFTGEDFGTEVLINIPKPKDPEDKFTGDEA